MRLYSINQLSICFVEILKKIGLKYIKSYNNKFIIKEINCIFLIGP